jgi:hypothetical protein
MSHSSNVYIQAPTCLISYCCCPDNLLFDDFQVLFDRSVLFYFLLSQNIIFVFVGSRGYEIKYMYIPVHLSQVLVPFGTSCRV